MHHAILRQRRVHGTVPISLENRNQIRAIRPEHQDLDAPRAKPLSNSTTQFGRFFQLPLRSIYLGAVYSIDIFPPLEFGNGDPSMVEPCRAFWITFQLFSETSSSWAVQRKIFARKRTMPSHPEMMSRSQLQAVWSRPDGNCTRPDHPMAQSLHIGLHWPFTNLPFGIRAINFDLKVNNYNESIKVSEDYLKGEPSSIETHS